MLSLQQRKQCIIRISNTIILVGCAQTAAVLDESMIGGMGDCWDFIIGWLID